MEVRVSVMSFFEIEKILSQLAWDAGIPKYFRASMPVLLGLKNDVKI